MAINGLLNSYSTLPIYPNKPARPVGESNVNVTKNQVRASIPDSSVQISDEARRLSEQAQKPESDKPDWAYDTTITTDGGKVIKTQWIDVNKMLDERLSAEDKRVLGFPFTGSAATSRTLLAGDILRMRDAGELTGNITKSLLLGKGVGQFDLANSPDFRTSEGQEALMDILSRADNA